MSQPADVPVTVRFPRDLHDRLVEVAEHDDRSLSSLLRHIVRGYLTGCQAGSEPIVVASDEP